jgi:hypothetical protein
MSNNITRLKIDAAFIDAGYIDEIGIKQLPTFYSKLSNQIDTWLEMMNN